MSALKFICPSCGQQMQCEKAYVGHQIPCPSCGSQLRVPASDAAGGAPGALPRAELVVANEPPRIASELRPSSEIPQEIIVKAESKKLAPAPAPGPEAHCICPVCQSELKVPPATPGKVPVAEVVHKFPAASIPAPAASAETSPLEREKQIAEARAAHPVELHPAVKPRLSYVLGGGAAPSEAENKSEAPGESDAQSRSE